MKKEDLNFAMENFLKSLPPEMRESEALKESLRTSESFKAFASGGGSLASPDVAAWAQEPSSPGKRTPPPPFGGGTGVAITERVRGCATVQIEREQLFQGGKV